MATHHSSLRNLPSISVNNSDDEDEGNAGQSSPYKFDYTSFPTLADPEQDNGKTLSTMITNTLRKVTNNASNLVHNYSRIAEGPLPSYQVSSVPLSPTVPTVRVSASVSGGGSGNTAGNANASGGGDGKGRVGDVEGGGGGGGSHSIEIKSNATPHTTATLYTTLFPTTLFTTATTAVPVTTIGSNGISETDVDSPQGTPSISSASTTHNDAGGIKIEANTISEKSIQSSTASLSSERSGSTPTISAPRIQSTSQGLRLTNLSTPKLQPSTTVVSTLTNDSSTMMATTTSITNNHATVTASSTSPAKRKSEPLPKKVDLTIALQNRISSIFNNLPNDIELSDDDSASDTETINNQSVSISPNKSNYNNNNNNNNNNHSHNHNHNHSHNNINTKDRKSPRNRKYTNSSSISKRSSNTHLSILDNAKSLINSGISNVVNSSSGASIMSSSKTSTKRLLKKKKKPKKPSENPLKSGGIPRFYWMNDSFVSDCLNCFKPFTAFRRKHHCRFCGQIFCNDCTLFISYAQHKEQRRNERAGIIDNSTVKKNYSDKLRVCKPCFSDVIVYLSDDSSSSSSEAGEGEEETEGGEEEEEYGYYSKSLTPVPQLLSNVDNEDFQHPLSRIRSQSISSRRDSLLDPNKGFLLANKIQHSNSQAVDDWSPSKSKRLPPNSGGSNTPEVINTKAVHNRALQMAIPTTRKGESVEIPIPVSSYSSAILNSTSVGGGGLAAGNESNITIPGSTVNYQAGTPNNLSSTHSNKTWLKNYSYLRNNVNSEKAHTSHSLENLSSMYNNFIRKQSIHQLPNDSSVDGSELNLNAADTDRYYSDEADVESENEDERVMSMYTSLNHYNGANGSLVTGSSSTLSPRAPVSQLQPIANSSTSTVVPTLGEFPLMMVEKRFPHRLHQVQSQTKSQSNESDLVLSKLFNNHESTPKDEKSVLFLDDKPKSASLRSHERAHASLLRMRSRRKSKSVRNILNFSQQLQQQQPLNRLAQIDTSVKSSISPMSTPNSPTPNFNSTTSLTGLKANDTNYFSSHHLGMALLNMTRRNGSIDELLPTTPTFNRHSGDYEYHDSVLDDSIYKYHPLGALIDPPGENFELENLLEDIGGDDSVIHYDTPYKSNELIYQEFLNKFFEQYLDDSGVIEDKEKWVSTIRNLFKTIDQLKVTDTLDTKQYIKIRRLLGGNIEDSRIVDGIFWTKNIDSKKMLSSIDNPKIALLMFPIEYLKQKEQFISLRIVHSQQNVYITNLVSRLISLEPDVIVVGDTVCGLAEKLLEEAKITVISNTKPQVIERISRYTKADIFQSVNDLFFKKGSLGTCKKLEVKKYLYQNVIKSFVYFTGNDISSGFTIALRGGSAPTLRVVKNATENTIPARLNSKFELSLFEDQFLIFRDYDARSKQIVGLLEDIEGIRQIYTELSKSEIEESNKAIEYEKETPATDANPTSALANINSIDNEVIELLNYNREIERFVSRFDNRIITTSPSVKLSLPIPLNNLAESYKSLALFYYKHKLIHQAQSINDLKDLEAEFIKSQFYNINIDLDKLPNREVDLLKILKYRTSNYLKILKNNFQSRLRLWSNCMNSIPLDPQRRNNIYVLNSTVSIKHSTPCYGPLKVVCDNYTENDMCLGDFLMKIILEAHNICNECGDTYLNHYKSYGHGNGKVDMVLEQIEDPITNTSPSSYSNIQSDAPQPVDDKKNQIFMWSYCTLCNSATPVVNMSDDTYNLSIGKFFELCFWGTDIIINSHECGHDFFKQHVRYFGCKDLAIKMVYSPIDTYEVIVPKKQLEYLPDIDIQLKIDALAFVKKKSSDFFLSISNRLNRVKVDTIDKIEDGLNKVEELKQKLTEQMHQIDKMTMDIYNSTSPSHHLPLNSVLRTLQDAGVVWDTEFNEFETEYLPSENEITRITQFHLRKFLIDKYSDEEKKRDDANIDDKKDDVKKEEKDEKKEEKICEMKDDDLVLGELDDKLDIIPKEPAIEDTPTDIVDTVASIDPLAPISNMPIESKIESPGSHLKSSPELRKEIGKMIPSTLLTVNNPQSNVMEKIHQMEALLENERLSSGIMTSPTKSLTSNSSSGAVMKGNNMISKSPLKKVSISHKSSDASINSSKDGMTPFQLLSAKENKVHHLANFFDQLHFDQISAEFKKQRELELKKKMNSYKAFPIVASKPIVEVYKKIEDAVDVEEKRELSESKKRTPSDAQAATEKKNTDIQQQSVRPKQQELGSDLPQPEKNSLLKSLTNFWADRSATLWDPLDYPLGSSEHTFADSDVIVREDEPSSLIAFCLSSTDYKQKLQFMSSLDEQQQQRDVGGTSTGGVGGGSGVTVISNAINSKKAAQFEKIEKKFKKNNLNPPGELEKIMNKYSTTHLKYQYLDGQTTLSCKIFYSEQFEAFRKACGNDDSFIQSLSRCVKWDSSGGKSGSSFLKTLDNRYILKELSKLELESFVAIAPFYFKYMSQSMFNTLTTAIAKIFGFYQIHIKNPITGKNFKMDFLIMENLFYNKKTTRIFDLKGSMRNRHVQQTGKENEVLLDENMIEYIYESPVFVREQSKALLTGSLFNDTAFLSAMDVMDYSLVIGIVDEDDDAKGDPTKKLLYVGIIDCIRTFTWDKKVENWVKGTNLIGKKGKDPTIITPKQYRTRFRAAMEKYILEVPDCWYNF